MNPRELLTKREYQIAELLAWGLTKKEIADRLFISYYTVDNHTKSIFEKTDVSTVNELAAWWFCNQYNIPRDHSPLSRSTIAIILLLTLFPKGIMASMHTVRRYNRNNRGLERTVNRTLRTITTRGRTFRFRDYNEQDLQLEF